MNRKKLLIGAAAVVVVIIGLVLVFNKDSEKTPTTTPVATKATVLVTDKGFSPSNLTVDSGTTVVWVNQDAKPHQIAADPYPSGSSLPGLFAKEPMGAEQSYSYTFKATGTWSYHDQLNPAVGGTVVVK